MNYEEISSNWEKDSTLDVSNISEESLKIPLLHNKYFKIYSQERYKYKKLDIDLKTLKLKKYEFYTQGPNEETPSDWELPAAGRVLKSEVGNYLDTDPDVVTMTLKLSMQLEKVEFLESIIKMINNRSFQLKNAVEWERFKNGG